MPDLSPLGAFLARASEVRHMPIDPATVTDPAISRLIRRKARQLCRRRGFTPGDRQDIEQELVLRVLQRLSKYDPARTRPESFVACIVEREAVSILRGRRAEKRSPDREECSLNDAVRDGDGRTVDRHQTTPEATTTWQRLHDLGRDVADLRERLPSDVHRLILDALARGETLNAIIADLGIPRRTAERRFAQLVRILENAGLREYL
jgi:RNA polymerase sigma factor (sigma-70 family)